MRTKKRIENSFQKSKTIRTPIFNATVPELLTLDCPRCGGHLNVSPSTTRFQCDFCGTEHLLRLSAGEWIVEPVIRRLERVESDMKVVEAEIKLPRLQKEVSQLRAHVEASRDKIERDLQRKITRAASKAGSANFYIITSIAGLMIIAFAYDLLIYFSSESMVIGIIGGLIFFLLISITRRSDAMRKVNEWKAVRNGQLKSLRKDEEKIETLNNQISELQSLIQR